LKKVPVFLTQDFQAPIDDDLETGPEIVSLKDPITRTRIKFPTKGKNCKHIQCFDGDTFIMYFNKPGVLKSECPVCNTKLSISDLIFDEYFEEILLKTDEDLNSVQIDQKGVWKEPEKKTFLPIKRASSSQFINLDNSSEKKRGISTFTFREKIGQRF
jgi:hypothetical protein